MTDTRSPDLPTPKQAVKDAENIFAQTKQFLEENPTQSDPEDIYSLMEIQEIVEKFEGLKNAVGERMEKDRKIMGKEIVDDYLESDIDNKDGITTLLLNVKGGKRGELHITHYAPINLEGEELDFAEVDDIYIDNIGIEIFRYDPKTHTKEEHFISSNDPNNNQVNQNTPEALKKAEELIDAYLKSSSSTI